MTPEEAAEMEFNDPIEYKTGRGWTRGTWMTTTVTGLQAYVSGPNYPLPIENIRRRRPDLKVVK